MPRNPHSLPLMSRKQQYWAEPKFCDATGLPILCVKCMRAAKIPKRRKRHHIVCDYHKALDEFRNIDHVDDVHTFDLGSFIAKIDWTKIVTSCQPELPILFRGYKKTGEEMARRVV